MKLKSISRAPLGHPIRSLTPFVVTWFTAIVAVSAGFWAPSPTDALKLKPVHTDQYDRPSESELASCTISPIKSDGLRGWEIRNGADLVLRRFLDTNGDNKVDQWCYFLGGVEVYRDIDANYNLKADQHRWLGTSGTRWGIDQDEDGEIDRWKWISAEEVAAEAVAAAAERNVQRLRRVLLDSKSLSDLGMNDERQKDIQTKIAHSLAAFAGAADNSHSIPVPSNAKWVYLGVLQPGAVPAGTDGLLTDLIVYENATAFYESDGEQHEFPLGTLIRTKNGWRLLELKLQKSGVTNQVASTFGYFFQASHRRTNPEMPSPLGLSAATQKLVGQLERIDAELSTAATIQAQAKWQAERADVLESLFQQAKSAEEQSTWIKQLADTISAAVQTGHFSAGIPKLEKLSRDVAKKPNSGDLAAFVEFRLLSARYTNELVGQNSDPAKAQENWITALEAFVKDHPKAEDTAEALLQLAIIAEFNGDSRNAISRFTQIVKDFPESIQAEKSAGAIRRSNSVGKRINIQGQTTDGSRYSLSGDLGKVMVVLYWATWSDSSISDLAALRQLHARFGGKGFGVVTVNLDADKNQINQFLVRQRFPWKTLFESGGLESRLAKEMGILTLPTLLLIDAKGQVVSQTILSDDLQTSVERLLSK